MMNDTSHQLLLRLKLVVSKQVFKMNFIMSDRFFVQQDHSKYGLAFVTGIAINLFLYKFGQDF